MKKYLGVQKKIPQNESTKVASYPCYKHPPIFPSVFVLTGPPKGSQHHIYAAKKYSFVKTHRLNFAQLILKKLKNLDIRIGITNTADGTDIDGIRIA